MIPGFKKGDKVAVRKSNKSSDVGVVKWYSATGIVVSGSYDSRGDMALLVRFANMGTARPTHAEDADLISRKQVKGHGNAV